LTDKGKKPKDNGKKDPLRFEGTTPARVDQKGWLRKRGIIAFVVVFVVIAVIWLFLVDYAVKKAVEIVGTEAVGARVELASADLHLSPLGITLEGLQVTNPDDPMTNVFEAPVITASLELGPLLRRKIIVDNLKIKGLRLATKREKSGAIKGAKNVAKKKKTGPLKKEFEMPSFEKPDLKAILASEKLETRDIIESLKKDIERAKGDWAGQIKGLPSKEKIEDYERRFKALEKSTKDTGIMGMLAGGTEFIALQKDLKKDLKAIKKANKGLERTLKDYKNRVNGIGKAVDRDVKRITDKYLMPSSILKNMTLMIFGERAAALTERGAFWYKRLEPFMERGGKGSGDGEVEVVEKLRGSGAWIRFKEHEPLPDLLIRKAQIEVETERGQISGIIKDITPDQKILGRPMTFKFATDTLKGVKGFTFSGTLDHINPEKALDELVLKVKGFSIKDTNLASSALPLTVKSAFIDLDLLAGLKAEADGRSLGSRFNMAFTKVRLIKGEPTGNKMQDIIADALIGIDSFKLRGSMTGKLIGGVLRGENLKISGDLDKIMERAVASVFTKEALGFKHELRSGLMKELGGDIDGLNGELGGLEALLKDLTDSFDLGKIDGKKGGDFPKIKF